MLNQRALPSDAEFQTGFFVAPVIFGEVTKEMTIAREEIFGPVAALLRFGTDDEAVDIAHDSGYGLTAAICTRDEVRASQLANTSK